MWRYYKMRAMGAIAVFYAPDLDTAFGFARGWRPAAKQWEYLGSTVDDPAGSQ